MSDWRPSASTAKLKARAQLLAQIRQFFSERGVLEVETPLLCSSTATDVHIQSWQAANKWGPSQQTLYLQTSPEFAMKRLLADGSGPIFQICKSFRYEETSKQHSPEFTMLEWYRLDFVLENLMDEVEQFLRVFIVDEKIPRYTYRDIFLEHLNLNPHSASLEELREVTAKCIDLSADGLNRTDYLQLLLSHVIEPKITGNWMLYDYPVEQAALAKVQSDDSGTDVAKRFEVFCEGMEIANGYFELTDDAEQLKRFEFDRATRKEKNLECYPVDSNLLQALKSGLPSCSGVALGVDRLLMLITSAHHIDDVLSFPIDRA